MVVLLKLKKQTIDDFNATELKPTWARALLHKRLSVLSKEQFNAQREAVSSNHWKSSLEQNIVIDGDGFSVVSPETPIKLNKANESSRLNFIYELVSKTEKIKFNENTTQEETDIHQHNIGAIDRELKEICDQALSSQYSIYKDINLTMFEETN